MIEPKHVQPQKSYIDGVKEIHRYVFDTGEGLLPHDHLCSHDLQVISGSLIVNINGKRQQLGAGGTLTFPAGIPHSMVADQPTVALTIFDATDAQLEKERLT